MQTITQGFSTYGPRTPGGPRGASKGSAGNPVKLETRRILTKQNNGHINVVGTYRLQRTELKTSLVFAMLCRLGTQS